MKLPEIPDAGSVNMSVFICGEFRCTCVPVWIRVPRIGAGLPVTPVRSVDVGDPMSGVTMSVPDSTVTVSSVLKFPAAPNTKGGVANCRLRLMHAKRLKKLRQSAEEAGVGLPASLGFERFQSILPGASELEDLSYELVLLEAVGTALKSAGPLTVTQFRFRDPERKFPEAASAHTEFILDMTLELPHGRFLLFLDALRTSPHLLSLSELTIEQGEGERAPVHAQVSVRAVYI